MAENNSTGPPIFIPPPPGSGPGPLGIPGGTDRSYQVDIIVCAVLTAVIGAVFVGLRFYARRIVVNVLGWEDWLILTSLVFSLFLSHSHHSGVSMRCDVNTDCLNLDLFHGNVCWVHPRYVYRIPTVS